MRRLAPVTDPDLLVGAATGDDAAVWRLDDDRGVEPLMHINLESKSAWYEIQDELPRYSGLPPMATDLLDPS